MILVVGATSCSNEATQVDHDNQTEIHYFFETSPECGSSFENNGTHLMYSWTLATNASSETLGHNRNRSDFNRHTTDTKSSLHNCVSF